MAPKRDGAAAAFDLPALPRDLQTRVLAATDWTSLAKCACVSRAFRQMAADINAKPMWRSVLTLEDPGENDPYEENWYIEAAILIDDVRFAARPDLCLVFATKEWFEYSWKYEQDRFMDYLWSHLPRSCSIVICYTSKVIGCTSHRNEQLPPLELDDGGCALSLSLIHLPPGANLRISPSAEETHRTGPADRGRLSASALAGLPPDVQPLVLLANDEALPKWWDEKLQEWIPNTSVAGGGLDQEFFSVSLAPKAGHGPPGYPYQSNQYANLSKSVVIAFHGPSVDVCTVSVSAKTRAKGLKELQAGLALAQERLAPLPQGQASALGCFMLASEARGMKLYKEECAESERIDDAFPGIIVAGSFMKSVLGPPPLPPPPAKGKKQGKKQPAKKQPAKKQQGKESKLLADSTVLSFVRLRAPPA